MAEAVKFEAAGIVPAIVQDASTGKVLMLAYMDRQAFDMSKESGYVHFRSRSRGRIWRKGETSGNGLRFVGAEADCDGDALLVRARPEGPACHLGRPSCFPSATAGTLEGLEGVLEQRRLHPQDLSYSSALFADEERRLKKVIEEAGELALAAKGGSDDQVVQEAADLTFHVLVLLAARGIPWSRVLGQLEARRR